MPLSIKYNVEDQPNGYNALLYDKTGDFQSSNPGGWNGSVNPAKAQITAATLDIYIPDSETGIPDEATSTTNQVDLFARGYPTVSPIYLVPADFLASTAIPDKIYLFKLTATYDTLSSPSVSVELAPVYWYGAFSRITECCAGTKIKDGCGCKNGIPGLTPTQVTVLLMRVAFYSLRLEEDGCADVARMAKILQYAKNLCNSSCKKCGS